MERVIELVRELFVRDLKTSPLETAIFLTVVFGFFLLLVAANVVKRKKEQHEYLKLLQQKWDHFCKKFGLEAEEIEFAERLSRFLRFPEKKYLLLWDYSLLHQAAEKMAEQEQVNSTLLKSIEKKCALSPSKQPSWERDIPEGLQRRKSPRKKVNIPVSLVDREDRNTHGNARIMDISTGGCRTSNPGGLFKAGDDLVLSFRYGKKDYRLVPGEVVRTSAKTKVLHIAFGHLPSKKERN